MIVVLPCESCQKAMRFDVWNLRESDLVMCEECGKLQSVYLSLATFLSTLDQEKISAVFAHEIELRLGDVNWAKKIQAHLDAYADDLE